MTAKFLAAAFGAAAFGRNFPGERPSETPSENWRDVPAVAGTSAWNDVDVPLCSLPTMPETVLPTAGDARRPYRAYTNLAHRDAHREPQAYGDACVS
jgi:hypothetical protein